MTEKPPKEDHHAYAHRTSIEVAMKSADPVLQPYEFNYVYWIAMGGFGFKPYIPGLSY